MIEIKRVSADDESQLKRLKAYQEKLQGEAEEKAAGSVPDMLEEIANSFCDNYCKWPDLWDEEIEGCELCESGICAECPVNRLI